MQIPLRESKATHFDNHEHVRDAGMDLVTDRNLLQTPKLQRLDNCPEITQLKQQRQQQQSLLPSFKKK